MRSIGCINTIFDKTRLKLHPTIKYLLVFIAVFALFSIQEYRAQCYENVTFEEWVTTGDSTSSQLCAGGGWVLGAGDSTLSSQCNSLFPLMYVGPDTLINVKITGSFDSIALVNNPLALYGFEQ